MPNFAEPLIPGKLLKRYKRFLADVELGDGAVITAHCPNPGSMMGLADAGVNVWLTHSRAKGRRLAHTLELVEAIVEGVPALTGINTMRPNRLVEAAILNGVIAELQGYSTLRREVKYGASSRIDLLLSEAGRSPCYVEVKNVHLIRRRGLAEFPDCKTARGVKHLQELCAMVAAGHRAVMVYCVQRGDAEAFCLARDLDPAYARAFAHALAAGVEAVCYRCSVTLHGIDIEKSVPILFDAIHNAADPRHDPVMTR